MSGEPVNNRSSTGKFKKGVSGNPKGREKGSTNKFTDLKKAFLDVFEKIEKESEKDEKIKGLYAWATKNDKNQGAFYQMIAKMLPSSVGVDMSGQIGVVIVSDKFLPKDNGTKPKQDA